MSRTELGLAGRLRRQPCLSSLPSPSLSSGLNSVTVKQYYPDSSPGLLSFLEASVESNETKKKLRM